MDVVDLAHLCRPVEERLSMLSRQGKAAVLGACGHALLPLLREVEERFGRRWVFPEAPAALAVSRQFAVGRAAAADNREIRGRLLASVPSGDELDSPWSSYATDALICVDAALVAASADLHHLFQEAWVYYALEPLVAKVSPNSYELAPDLLSPGGRLRLAVDFLDDAVRELGGGGQLSDEEYDRLAARAAVLNPGTET